MDHKEVEPEIINMRFNRGVHLMASHLCVNCFPVQKAGVFIWCGLSICQECFIPLRKQVDAVGLGKLEMSFGVEKRDYVKTWGEEPIQDAEEV